MSDQYNTEAGQIAKLNDAQVALAASAATLKKQLDELRSSSSGEDWGITAAVMAALDASMGKVAEATERATYAQKTHITGVERLEQQSALAKEFSGRSGQQAEREQARRLAELANKGQTLSPIEATARENAAETAVTASQTKAVTDKVAALRTEVGATATLTAAYGLNLEAIREAELQLKIENATLGMTADLRDELTAYLRDEEQATRALAVAQKQFDLTAQITDARALADAWRQGAGAAREADIAARALADIRSLRITDPTQQGKIRQKHTDLADAQSQQQLAKYEDQMKAAGRKLDLDRRLIGAAPSTAATARARFEVLEWLRAQGLEYSKLDAAQKREADNVLQLAQANARVGAEIEKWNAYGDVFGRAFDRVGDAISQAFTEGGGAAINFRSIVSGVLSSIASDLLKLAVVNPVKNALLGGLGGLFGGVSPVSAGLTGAVNGMTPLGLWQGFHSGGVVGQASMRIGAPASVFGGAPRYHGGGIAGLAPDEVPAILRRREEVLTEDDPRHRYNLGRPAPADRPVPVGTDSSVRIGDVHVAVTGSAGTPEQNTDLARRVGSEVREQLRSLVMNELRQQMRSGGMLAGTA